MSDTALNQLRRAAAALQSLRQRYEALEARQREPVAIVGASCRFPGGCNNPDLYWRLISHGVDAVGPVPADRWSPDFYDPDPAEPGKSYVREGGFLDRVDEFDSQFFGIAPREADQMDPQQRLALELAWEALENAGCAANRLAGSATGVFLGLMANDYGRMLQRESEGGVDIYAGTGNDASFLAGRISYVLGLQGPSLVVSTSCSSSLIAAHLAVQSLRRGECRVALAGGVSLMLSPDLFILLSKMRALAPDGRCHSFDAAANGFGRGEGGGMIVLKRLTDAVADRDSILAVLRGSATNHDGRSNGLTAPNGAAQEALLVAALADAGVEPSEIGYLEAHGTGTSLGDPIELQAAANILTRGRPANRPFRIGSVKANFGHLEAAAGVASLLKVALVVRYGAFPPQPNFQRPNPQIPWDTGAFVVPRVLEPWITAGKRIAAVSAFGMSGTNAHAVVESWEEPAREREAERPGVLVLSAATEAALRAQARQYADYLERSKEDAGDIAFTAAVGRVGLPARLVVGGGDWKAKLRAESQGIWRGQAHGRPKIAFLYSGQGAQYAGMGEELYAEERVFREEIGRLSAVVAGEWGAGELERLLRSGSAEELRETRRTQAVVYALECALTKLWESWGIAPDVVVGHSVGEYAAAVAAGIYSAEAGMRLMSWRGERMGGLAGGGGMAAVMCSATRVAGWLEEGVEIAADNAADSVVVSGEAEGVARVVERAQRAGVVGQGLAVSHAFHSARMEPLLAEWEEQASGYGGRAGKAVWISTVTGARVAEVNGGYWRRQVRERVRYREAVERVLEEGCGVLVEVGPGSTLVGLGKRSAGATGKAWLVSLAKGRSGREQLEETAARLWAEGAEVDWEAYYRDRQRRRVALPTYPFQRQRHWLEEKPAASAIRRISSPVLQSMIFEQELQSFPADVAAYMGDLFRGLEIETDASIVAKHVNFENALPPAGPLVGQAIVTPQAQGVYAFEWFVRPRQDIDRWRRMAQATLYAGKRNCEPAPTGLLYQSVWRAQTRPRTSALPAVWYVQLTGQDAEWERRLVAALESEGSSQVVAAMPGASLNLPDQSVGVVYLATAGCFDGDLPDDQVRLQSSLLSVAKWLSRRTLASSLRIVTRQAQRVENDEVAPIAPWTAAGFCRVLAQEHPELSAMRIDIGPDTTPAELARELTGSFQTRETEIALRPGGRFVRRLVPAAVPASSAMVLNPAAAYVVAGASGGLGRETALWLARKGARRLVLLQRTAADPAVLAELRSAGAEASIERLDITDRVAVLAVFESLARRGVAVGGVVHAAGIMDQGLIGSLDPAQIERVFAARIAGAWNLHLATASLPLDFFILYSSLSAALGIVGLSTYAASHAFLDGLAEYRRSRGLAGLSVQWSAWEDVGLGKLIGIRENDQFRSHGGQRLSRTEAFGMLERLLPSGMAVAAVFRMDWKKLADQFPENGIPRFLSEIIGESTEAALASRQDPREMVLSQLRQTLQLPDAEAIPMDRPLTELGLDSMLAIDLRNRLARAFQRQLPATVLFNYPTVRELVNHLTSATRVTAPTEAAPPRPANGSAHLTDSQAEKLLIEKLAYLTAREWR